MSEQSQGAKVHRSEITFSSNGDPPGIYRREIHANMKSAKAKWHTRLAREYSFEFERVCYECPDEYNGPFSISVESGQVTSAVYTESGESVSLEVFLGLYCIEDMFDSIESESNQDINYMKVDYDESQGYPRSLAVSHFGGEKKELKMHYVKNVDVRS